MQLWNKYREKEILLLVWWRQKDFFYTRFQVRWMVHPLYTQKNKYTLSKAFRKFSVWINQRFGSSMREKLGVGEEGRVVGC